MNTPLLEVRDLSVFYGKVEAVRGVSLSVPQGAIVSVIGANGAGKTTLLNALMGIMASEGGVNLGGAPLSGLTIEQRVAAGLSLVPEKRELFTTMTVEDNLMLGGFRTTAAERATALETAYDRFPRLKERRRQIAGTLSGGERQMLAMGRALMNKPRLLMLDEPSLGLAPRITEAIFEIVVALRAAGVAILLVEQNARGALQISDYGYVIELGGVTREGPARDLAADPRVIESYLGFGVN